MKDAMLALVVDREVEGPYLDVIAFGLDCPLFVDVATQLVGTVLMNNQGFKKKRGID